MSVIEQFVAEEAAGDSDYTITVKDQRGFVRHVARGATRDLCIQGLRDVGYTVEADAA